MEYEMTCSLYHGSGGAFGAAPVIRLMVPFLNYATGTVTVISNFAASSSDDYVWVQCSGSDPAYVTMTYATVSAVSVDALD